MWPSTFLSLSSPSCPSPLEVGDRTFPFGIFMPSWEHLIVLSSTLACSLEQIVFSLSRGFPGRWRKWRAVMVPALLTECKAVDRGLLLTVFFLFSPFYFVVTWDLESDTFLCFYLWALSTYSESSFLLLVCCVARVNSVSQDRAAPWFFSLKRSLF